jgi:hypothetical protein
VLDACLSEAQPGDTTFSVKYLRNPSSVVPKTSAFKVTILTQDGDSVCASTDTATVSGFTPGKIKNFNVTFADPSVQKTEVSADITLTLSSRLESDSYVEISVPQNVTVASALTCKSLNTIYQQFTPSCSFHGDKIVIRDLFYGVGYDPEVDQPIELRFLNAFGLPDSVKGMDFTVATYTALK